MGDEGNGLDDLCREIRRLIEGNRKFLERVMDEDFEPEDGEDVDGDRDEDL